MKNGHLLWNLKAVMEERLAATGGEVAFWTCGLGDRKRFSVIERRSKGEWRMFLGS